MFITIVKLIIIIIVTIFWSTLAVITGPLNRFLPAYHYISTTWAKWLIWVSGVTIHTIGLENIQPNVNYVFISNHSSLFDIPILLSTIKNEVKMVAKKELIRIPLFGWSLVAGGYIIVDRHNPRSAFKALKKAEQKLRKGTSILLFPEGTRSKNGSIQSFKKGAFILAMQTKFDILPISIIGSHKVMPRDIFRINPITIQMIVDKPISTKEIKNKEKDAFIEKMRNLIISNYEKGC